MRTIHRDKLKIMPNRQRQLFNEKPIGELATSIETKGLLHAPILRDDEETLLAGERRVRACLYLHDTGLDFTYEGNIVPHDHIPYTLAKNLSPIDLEEAELEENLLREDLTWQEKADAISRLKKLRDTQKAEVGEKETLVDFIKELTGPSGGTPNAATVKDDLLLAEHLHDPLIAKEKDRKTALKKVKQKLTNEHNARLAQEFKNAPSRHKVIHDSCLNILPKIRDSIDIIIADPPYGVGADSFGEQAGASHDYEDSEEAMIDLMLKFAPLSFQVTKPQAHLYLFCDIRYFFYLSMLFGQSGWDVWESPIIWNKQNGMLPRPEHAPRRCYETILYGIKGNRTINAVYSDIIDIPAVARPQFGAEKPASLYENLLTRSARPNDIVLDPFAGTGPVLAAAASHNCNALAIELNQAKYNHMLVKLQEIESGKYSEVESA